MISISEGMFTLNFKRFWKALVCVICCMACLICVSPVSALTGFVVPNNPNAVPGAPALPLTPESNGHLVSYVRYSAYASSSIIGCLEDGTKITVLGTKNKFYRIDCYDMKGYILKSQVRQDEAGNYYVAAQEGSSESTRLPSYTTQESLQLQGSLVKLSKKYIGVKYKLGGSTPRAFDCSGYIQYVFREAGVAINRNVITQLQNGVIIPKDELQPGDLIIFSNTGDRGFASHVGMYLGNGKLIHCGESKGVCIVDLDSTYFAKHYQCARRILLTDANVSATVPTLGVVGGGLGADWRN